MDGNSELVAYSAAGRRRMLLRRGRLLDGITPAWNVVGIVVPAIAAIGARSVALAGLPGLLASCDAAKAREAP
jgi:hypothetical protein